MRQDFWSRWHLEYLNELQKRQKWTEEGPAIDVGKIVMVKDKAQPCSQWVLGKIIEVHRGEDGIIRAATVKTVKGNLKRTTKLLCPLPTD